MNIREAEVADAKVIQAIYAPYVEQTAVTFEYNVPSEDEFRRRIATRRWHISTYAERSSLQSKAAKPSADAGMI